MKKWFFLFLLIPFFLQAQERQVFSETVYDPFFSISVEDSMGDLYRMNGTAFYNLQDEKKYFLWVRRGTEMGIVTYSLELDRIVSIEFTAPYGTPDDNYTPAVLELSDGSSFEVFVGTSGYFGGYDQDFGSRGRLYLTYNQIHKIEFNHKGSYSRCSYCGTVFFDEGREICPFDGTALEYGKQE